MKCFHCFSRFPFAQGGRFLLLFLLPLLGLASCDSRQTTFRGGDASSPPTPGADIEPRLEIDIVEYREGEVAIAGWQTLDLTGSAAPGYEAVLVNGDVRLTYPPTPKKREDVAALLKRPELADSGFEALIPLPALKPGAYRVGVQPKGDGSKLLLSKKRVQTPAERLDPPPVASAPPSGDITFVVDALNNDKGFVSVSGWAYRLDSEHRDSDLTALVLISPARTYAFKTFSEKRPDLVQTFGQTDLENAGYTCLIDSRRLEPGNYEVTLAIRATDGWTLAPTKQTINF
jgi:hypothetical protein